MKGRELLLISYMFQEKILNNFMRRKYQERRRKAGTDRERGGGRLIRKRKGSKVKVELKLSDETSSFSGASSECLLLDVCVINTYVLHINIPVDFGKKTLHQY